MGDCTADWHSVSSYAYRRRGCRCPETVAYTRKLAASQNARSRARHGKAPTYTEPVDEIAVQRAMGGDRIPLTPRERGLAISELTRRGLSVRQIAERIGYSSRQVLRYRSGLIKRAREAA